MQNIYDQLAKQLALRGYENAGDVETDVEVGCDLGRIDVAFTPRPHGDGAAGMSLAPLGLFGRLAAGAMVLEAFHQCPTAEEIISSILKHQHYRLPAHRKGELVTPPTQWIISAGRPTEALVHLGFLPDPTLGPGVYEGPPAFDTRLIVTSELPRTRHTLVVRLYGAGRTFNLATEDLRALPEDSPETQLALPILVRLRRPISPNPDEQTPEEKEFMMDTYWTMESVVADLHREGRQEAFASMFRKHFTRRFGPLPADLAPLLDKPRDAAELEHWTDLAISAPLDEILAALRAAK